MNNPWRFFELKLRTSRALNLALSVASRTVPSEMKFFLKRLLIVISWLNIFGLLAKPEMNIQVDTGEEGTEQSHQPEGAEDGGQATEMIVSDTQGILQIFFFAMGRSVNFPNIGLNESWI